MYSIQYRTNQCAAPLTVSETVTKTVNQDCFDWNLSDSLAERAVDTTVNEMQHEYYLLEEIGSVSLRIASRQR